MENQNMFQSPKIGSVVSNNKIGVSKEGLHYRRFNPLKSGQLFQMKKTKINFKASTLQFQSPKIGSVVSNLERAEADSEGYLFQSPKIGSVVSNNSWD